MFFKLKLLFLNQQRNKQIAMYTLNRTGNLTCLQYSNKAYYTEHPHMRHCRNILKNMRV